MVSKVYTNIGEFQSQELELGIRLPFAESTECLKAPLQLKNKVIPNRLACQAMEGCDGTADGRPDDLTIRRYDRFAKGGAGIIWFEATAVMEEGRANPRQLWITEGNVDSFARQVERIRETALRENG